MTNLPCGGFAIGDRISGIGKKCNNPQCCICENPWNYLGNNEIKIKIHPWISVSEKLPNEDGKYLLFLRGKNIVIGSFIKKIKLFSKNKVGHICYKLKEEKNKLFYDWDENKNKYKCVTHWMPLPSPPTRMENNK